MSYTDLLNILQLGGSSVGPKGKERQDYMMGVLSIHLVRTHLQSAETVSLKAR